MQWKENRSLLNCSVELQRARSHAAEGREQPEHQAAIQGRIVRTDRQHIWVEITTAASEEDLRGTDVHVALYDSDGGTGSFAARVLEQSDQGSRQMLALQYPAVIESSDQRQHPRADARISASLYHISTKGVLRPFKERRRNLAAVIRDLNETGTQILTTAELPSEARVVVDFSFRGVRFQEPADVMWSRFASGHFLYGLRFSQPNFVLQDMLRAQSVSTGEDNPPDRRA